MKSLALLLALMFAPCATALGAPQPDAQPKKEAPAGEKRAGDPYPLATCPISGQKLGSMGDPVVKLYEGREVRFCCDMCLPKFEKDLAKSMSRLDADIIKDQLPIYPTDESIVSAKKIGDKPIDFVYANRLIRLHDEQEKATFLKNPGKYLADLDKAVIEAQGMDYPLTRCPVSNHELGGEMGKPVDYVLAGRLIRLCCRDCVKEIEKEPAKYVAAIDKARAGASTKNSESKPERKQGESPK
jgi:YHS domain-containing protein